MNTTIRTTIVCLAVACVSIAATSQSQKRLTAHRVAELITPTDAPRPQAYKVAISGLGSAALQAAKPAGQVESIREFRFPTEFAPPQATADATSAVIPTTPTASETINTGWTVRLSAKPLGKLVAVYGVADCVEAELVPGGYGAVAGPIYNDQGDMLTPNKLEQPKVQTTSTRFHIFAVPGESYEVTLYQRTKSEKHSVTVTTE